MTLKQIEAFYWAAILGNFAIAADRLHITQSSLSKRISELEEHLGHALFDRSRKKAQLTDAGERLLPHCRSMLDMVGFMQQDIRNNEVDQPLRGICRFGISELSASTWLPRFTDKVRAIHPLLVLEPQIWLTGELERLVQRGELDFAVVAGGPANASIAQQQVARVEFVWVASPKVGKSIGKLSGEDLARLDVLSHPPDSGLATAFNSWLVLHRLKVRRVVVCNSLTVITGLTVTNMGISFLPQCYVQPLVDRARLVMLESDPPLPSLDYNFIWLRDDMRPMTQIMKSLILPEIDFTVPNALWA